jgi:hypothetical protein
MIPMNIAKLLTLVVIDSAVAGYKSLISGVHPEAEVLVLDPLQDGIKQITEAIGDRTHLKSLHLVTHGQAGEIQLGSTRLNQRTLKQFALPIQGWAKALRL